MPAEVRILGLLNAVRRAREAPEISDSELRTDSRSFVRHHLAGSGLAWLGELFGADLTFSRGTAELVLCCSSGEEARRVRELTGCRAIGGRVVLPTVVQALATAYPDWIEADEDGAILGWLYPVPQPDGPDAWARQGTDTPFPASVLGGGSGSD